MDDLQTDEKEPKYFPNDYFYITNDLSVSFVFRGVEQLSSKPVIALGNSFCENMVAVDLTAASVCIFVRKIAHSSAFSTMSGISFGIRTAMGLSPVEVEGFEKAELHTRDVLERPDWNQRFNDMSESIAMGYLSHFLDDEMGRGVSMDILRQCTVLTWSAFEVLCSDLFRHLTNSDPRLAALLLKNERTKKFYQSKDLVTALEEHDYNLSCTMGDVLLGQCRLDNLQTIRVIYDVLFSENEHLRAALNDGQLWRLYQIRNLIVHRAAVVDAHFIKSTGLGTPVGQKLRIVPQELKDFMILVGQAGLSLLKAADSSGNRSLGDSPNTP